MKHKVCYWVFLCQADEWMSLNGHLKKVTGTWFISEPVSMSISQQPTHTLFLSSIGVANSPRVKWKKNLSSALLRAVYLRTALFLLVSTYSDGLYVFGQVQSLNQVKWFSFSGRRRKKQASVPLLEYIDLVPERNKINGSYV